MLDIFFIGDENNPIFMIEFNILKKKVIIYKPDKYSLKISNFFEKYTLGEILYEKKYKKYFYIKNECKLFKKFNKEDKVFLLKEILIKTNDSFLLIKDSIYEKNI